MLIDTEEFKQKVLETYREQTGLKFPISSNDDTEAVETYRLITGLIISVIEELEKEEKQKNKIL